MDVYHHRSRTFGAVSELLCDDVAGLGRGTPAVGWRVRLSSVPEPLAHARCLGVRVSATVWPNQSAAANRRPAGQADGSGNLSAIVAADRAFPAAVAELGR